MPDTLSNGDSGNLNDNLGVGFVSAVDPKNVMRMPGCHELAVNKAHGSHFDGCFMEVGSPQEFKSVLEHDANKDRQNGTVSVCYCEKVNAIIALTSKHCVFESIFEAAARQPNTRWHSSLAFLKLKQNGVRNYEVFGTKAQAARVRTKDYLESRFMPLGGLAVTVHASEQQILPERLTVSAEVEGEEFLKPETFKVERQEGYLRFDSLLATAVKELSAATSPSNVKQRLIDDLKNISEVDYGPVAGFLSGIFNDDAIENGNKLIGRIVKIRERLFDSLVVVEKVRDRIKEKLNDGVSNSFSKNISLHSRIELARWKVPIELIEQEEEYVWLKRQPQPDPFVEQGELACGREHESFTQQLPQLQKSRPEKFVAISEGEIIDEDLNEIRLVERIGREGADRFVLIEKVTKQDSPHVWVDDSEEVET